MSARFPTIRQWERRAFRRTDSFFELWFVGIMPQGTSNGFQYLALP